MTTINNKVITVESLKAVHDYNKETYMMGFEPIGTGSLSLNRKADSDIGLNSVAEGNNTTASGDYSHAEGFESEAVGNMSHAEGINSIASGEGSHVEGYYTETRGRYSHAEGQNNITEGECSHVEGVYNVALGDYQHVEGKYAIIDTENPNLYAHIVGNGTSTTERSNAHTLDWDGNAWYAGDFSADGNMILSSNQYGDELPVAGNVGRIFFKRLVE